MDYAMDDFIPTRISQVKTNALENYYSVNYTTLRKTMSRKVTQRAQASEEKETVKKNDMIREQKSQEIDMKRARHDVVKFGMLGLEKINARQAKVNLALNLGAKLPKNKNFNYKTLKTMRKSEKQKDKSEEFVSGLEKSLLRKKTKKPMKKQNNGILGVYGNVVGDINRKSYKKK